MRRPSPTLVVALLALAVALGGTSWASSKSSRHQAPKHADASRDRALVKSMAGGLSVKSAKSASHASSADRATVAGSAGSAAPSGAAGGDLQGSYPNPKLKAPVVTGLTIPAVSDCQSHPLTLCASTTTSYWNQPVHPGLSYSDVIVDGFGFVHLQGAVQVIGSPLAPAFFLPPSMRPSAALVFPAMDVNTGAIEDVTIQSNGAVNPGARADGHVISLSGISFHP